MLTTTTVASASTIATKNIGIVGVLLTLDALIYSGDAKTHAVMSIILVHSQHSLIKSSIFVGVETKMLE